MVAGNVVVHVFARPWPPREGIARYVETISIAERTILKDNVKIALISLWDYASPTLEKYRDFIVMKIPRIRRFLARSETIYSLLQVNQLRYILKFLNTHHSAFLHIHMPVYVGLEQQIPFGITFHGYTSPIIFRMYDTLIPYYIIKNLCRYSKFNTVVGLTAAMLLRKKLGINVKPVLTPVPYDVLSRTLKRKTKVRKRLIVINTKDPLKAFNILQALIRSNVITKYRLNVLVFGLKTTHFKRFISQPILENMQHYHKIKILGYLPREEQLRFLSNALLFIYTSPGGEGMPTLVIEALALGTPTIVPYVIGCIDLAKMYNLPIYRDHEDVVAIVEQVLEMYKDYVHIFNSIREKVLKIHSPEAIARHFIELYGLI